ncbi:hypothetical protein, variant 2 [Verruconis gallopava]|nr:hypothetical protein, variant 2 [Verruconis gallopava]KIW05220.1 hypothetical protein, variant 2 [Verruconis gallopava]
MTSSGSKAVEHQHQQSGGTAATPSATKPPAWSRASINPVTQRASGSPVQNGIKSNGTASSSSASNAFKPHAAASAAPTPKDPSSAERLMFLFANFKGLNATLLLKNGDRYTGVFSSISNGQYIVKMAKKLSAQGKQPNGVNDEAAGAGPDRTLALNVQDVVDLAVNEVRFDKTHGRGQNGASTGFRTDADISSGWHGRERELQKWEPADNDADVDHSIENGNIGAWDQFAEHKKMTGLESTYDESNYTTTLDRSRPGFEEAVRKADQIAREIESSSTTNAHVAEERGVKGIDDSGLDEEDKYSGVQREFKPLASGGPNRYTPPAMRAPTGQPTVPGAPVDPAIISSAFADSSKSTKPSATGSTKNKIEETPTAKSEQTKDTAAEKEVAAVPATSTTKPAAAPAVAATSVNSTTTSATAATTPAPVTVSTTSEKTTAEKPVTAPAPASTKPSVPAPLPSTRLPNKEGSATATVEKDVHEAFKEFNKSEKLRVQEHQRSLARRDKAVKLNDLKKFAQNFKLHTEVPADLLPILARDEKKQREIKEKAKRNAEDTKSTPPRSTATSVSATPSDAKTKPITTSKNDSGPTSPLVSNDRQPQQRSRQSSTNMVSLGKGVPQHIQGAGPAPGGHRQHGNLGPRLAMNAQNRGVMPQQQLPQHPMPIPDPRMTQTGITSPTTALRFDPSKSFVPSKPFVPGGSNASSGSSPVRPISSQPVEPKAPTPGNLFEGRTEGRKGPIPDSERVSLDNYFNPIPTLKKEHEASLLEAKRAELPNVGLPPSYKTKPTWEDLVPDDNKEKTYKAMFPNSLKPAASPQQHIGPNQFQHQLPYGGAVHHAGFVPQVPANQTPRHMVAQPHHAGGPGTPQHHFDEAQRMHFSHSASSVHPSPRPMQPFVYNPQAGPPGQFPAQMVYGTSPSGGYGMVARQLSNNPQFHAQPPQMVAAAPGGPPAMYVQGMPAGYMMPAGAQAFFPHGGHMAPQPGASGFPSPANRPAMMAPQGSQSGHNTPQVIAPYFPGQAGPGQPMRYGVPPQHHQYPGNPQHFPQHVMRGGPSGSYPQPMMSAPQAMIMQPGQMAPESGEDGK